MPIAPELPKGVHQFNFPTQVRFGVGAVKELPAALREAGASRALVVTDGGLVDTEAYLLTVAALGDFSHCVFAGVEPNPLADQADRHAGFE